MSTHLKRILQFIFFLSLGIFLIWLSVKDIAEFDRAHIQDSFLRAKPFWILICIGSLFLSHFIRALRWRLLIVPLGFIPKKQNLLFAVFIGYLVNMAVPRMGEVVKCTTVSKYEKIQVDKLLGTIITERIIDTLSLSLIFLFTFWLQPSFIKKVYVAITSVKDASSAEIHTIGNFFVLFLIVVAVIIFSVFTWMYIANKSIKDIIFLFKQIVRRLGEGIFSIQKLKQKKLFIVYTFLIWSLYCISGYFGFLTLNNLSIYGIKEALMVLCSGSIGMIVTPGGVGAYTFVIQKTMEIYGASAISALTYGWLLWIMQTGIIFLGGILSLILLPLTNQSTHYKNKF